MRVLTYDAGNGPRLGIYVDGHVYDVEQACASVSELKTFTKPGFATAKLTNPQMLEIVALGEPGLQLLQELERHIHYYEDKGDPLIFRRARIDQSKMTWLPPILNPPLVFGIGGNSPLFFRDKSYQIPSYPRGFLRPVNRHALIGHLMPVVIPPQYQTMRASAEMGVVIGRAEKNVSPAEAMKCVFGYTIVNDMCSDSWKAIALGGKPESLMHEDITVFTARAATSYYSRSTDTFAAVGPWIVTKEEVRDPYNLLVYSRLSGVQRDRGYTQAMVNGIEQTLAFLSRMFTLQPGMIIHMGTMGIDGFTVEADMPLGQDDYFEMEYEEIGALRNYVKDLRPINGQ